MKINYNVSAMIANSALSHNDKALSGSLEKLSSGLKINHAKDNASGLAMAKRMNAQIRSLEVANQNSNDGVSVIEIAEGALQEVEDMIQRMNELAVKACNGTMSDSDRETIDAEIKQLKGEIERISNTTMYNGQVLLNGNFDVKGYTSDLNLKVTTYSNDVRSGDYVIESIKTVYDSEGKLDPEGCEIVFGEGFPQGCTATFEGDKIKVKGTNGFSMEYRVMPDDFEDYKANVNTNALKVSGIIVDKDANNERFPYITGFDPQSLFPADSVFEGEGRVEVKDATDTKIGEYEVTKNTDGTDIITVYDDLGNATTQYTFEKDKIIKNDVPADPTTEEVYRVESTFTGEVKVDASGFAITHIIADHDFKLNNPNTANPADKSIKLNITGLGNMKMQTGSNEGQELGVRIQTMSLRTLGIDDKDCSTYERSMEFLDQMNATLSYINSARSQLGAYQNRLEHTISTLDISEENMTGAYSRIMDVDMAEEMTEYTKNNVLVQAGTSMLAQANERPSSVLQLLQG